MTTEKKEPNAMAFYHRDGLTAAWQQAMMFAEKDGRIATMPDIVAARLQAKPSASVWDKYYTTLTAEYVGYSRGGNLVLVVAHGIGPMATLEGIQKAYSWQYNDKSRNRRGGRITEKEFLDLVDGSKRRHYRVSCTERLRYCTGVEIANENAIRQHEMYRSFWSSVTAAYDRSMEIRKMFMWQ